MEKSIKWIWTIGLLSLIVFSSCKIPSKEAVLIKFNGNAQGTYYAIRYFDTQNRNFQKDIEDLLKQFDLCASLWCENSELVRINNNENIALSPMFIDLFNKSVSISKLTDGYFDFTVGTLVNAYGFGKNKIEGRTFSKEELKSLLDCVGYKKVGIEDGYLVKENACIRIDFNAIAQGYSVDLIAAFFETKGIEHYLIDVGGEVYGKGKKINGSPWIVGIEKPSTDANAGREIIERIALENQALNTSGNYRKYFEDNGNRYSHTINPFTGEALHQNLLSVSVINPKTWKADALATAFMVMGLEKTQAYLANDKETEAFLIFSNKEGDYETWYSEGFKKYILR